jgi:hypothetical protein
MILSAQRAVAVMASTATGPVGRGANARNKLPLDEGADIGAYDCPINLTADAFGALEDQDQC